jgi:DNA-binding CsgD family transcriptional regulator
VRLIGQQKTNAQIGKELGYATTTIHAECSDIYQILAVGNRGQAFALVAEFLNEQ